MDSFRVLWTRAPYECYLSTLVDLTKYDVTCENVQLPANFPTMLPTFIDAYSESSLEKSIMVDGGRFETLEEYTSTLEEELMKQGVTISFISHRFQPEMMVSSSHTLRLSPALAQIFKQNEIPEGETKIVGPVTYNPKMGIYAPFVPMSYVNGDTTPLLGTVDILTNTFTSMSPSVKCSSTPSMLRVHPIMVSDRVYDDYLLRQYDVTILLNFRKRYYDNNGMH